MASLAALIRKAPGKVLVRKMNLDPAASSGSCSNEMKNGHLVSSEEKQKQKQKTPFCL